MPRKNEIPDQLDLDALEGQLDDLDLDLEGEDLEIDDVDLDDSDLEEDDSSDDGGVRTVTIEIDGEDTEVEVTEKGLKKLKKPQILSVFDVMNIEPKKRTAKKDILIDELLGYVTTANEDLVMALDDEGDGEDLEMEELETETPESNTEKSSPVEHRLTLDESAPLEGGRELIRKGLSLRMNKVAASNYSPEAKKAAIEQLQYAEQLISLFLD